MILGVIIEAGMGGRGGWQDKAERDGSQRWGCAGSHGPGDDKLGGVGEEPRCSAWLISEASKLQTPHPHLCVFNVILLFFQF